MYILTELPIIYSKENLKIIKNIAIRIFNN